MPCSSAGAAAAGPGPLLDQLQAAVETYRGDFLEGFSLDGSPEFDDWASLQREEGCAPKISLAFVPPEATAPALIIVGYFMMKSVGDIDWRDADDLKRPNGAEEPEYRAAGLDYKPANAPFQAIEELQLVLGMRPDIYRRLAPSITVFSRSPGVNAPLLLMMSSESV